MGDVVWGRKASSRRSFEHDGAVCGNPLADHFPAAMGGQSGTAPGEQQLWHNARSGYKPLIYLALALMSLGDCGVFAQGSSVPYGQRPGDTRPRLPTYQTPLPTPEPSLPKLVPPPQGPLSTQAKVFVRHFKLVGNTVFSGQELARVTAPYENRVITSEELIDGKGRVTVIRLSQDWLERGLNQVIAARFTFSLGIDAFNATVHDSLPDGQFLTGLGQFQWARRFGNRGYQALFRTDLQLANHSLLSMEKCAVGGADTVRGYRENVMVRDNCWIASLEFRIPLFRLPLPDLSRGPEEGVVQLAPFVDYGRAWNKSGPTLEPTSISSAGLGLRWDPSPKIHTELYWGHAFRDVEQPDPNWQDEGIHFQAHLAYPW